MGKTVIITAGTVGVDMRENPLFLQNTRASSATNLTFDESTIKVRYDIEYHNLGLKGAFQGSTYYTPSTGLSATSYSEAGSSLAIVSGGSVTLNIISEKGISCNSSFLNCEGESLTGDTYLYDAENYLVILNDNHDTFWSESGGDCVRSPGLNETGGESHDQCDNESIVNWLPNEAELGHYIHARSHISCNFNNLNSEIWVSDIGGKRSLDDCTADDILKMEEAMLDSGGGTLVSPSKFGKTVALETLPSAGNNGEGILVDFRECGVLFHNTFETPRETLYDPQNSSILQAGWDEKRLTNVQLQTVSATGRYAVWQLPDDIFFRSRYGFHFLKKTLGTGTLRDEKRNHEAHDIQPLLDIDEDGLLEGVSTGYWLLNDRLMGTVGLIENSLVTSSSMGRGLVVLNQATTYTEDDTPRNLWEGLWLPDNDIAGIHKFTKLGARHCDHNFGFIASDSKRKLFVGEFKNYRSGYDTRCSEEYLIPWQYTSGAFAISGLQYIDQLRSAYIDIIGDESTQDVQIQVRTDQHDCWETWADIKTGFTGKSLKSTNIGEPSNKDIKEATWFQFRIKGLGYIEIRTFEIDTVKINRKNDGRNACIPVCSQPEDYFNI